MFESPVSASLNSASSTDVAPSPILAFIAKISPVGPLIGCTPQISYAIKLGIDLRTKEIKTGSQFATASAVDISASVKKLRDSFISFSWFSKITAVTARL